MAHNSWFAAYMLYALQPIREVSFEDVIRAQEDLTLFYATDLDEAQERAMELGREIADVGTAFSESDVNRLSELNLGVLTPLVQIKDGSAPAPEIPNQQEFVDHLRRYEAFEFLGLARSVPVALTLADGTLIDSQTHAVSIETVESWCTDKEDLAAFSPVGPALSGLYKEEEEKKLYDRFKWFLAEELFAVDARNRLERIAIHERLVLIRADGPEEAFRRALNDGNTSERLGILTDKYNNQVLQFLGLRELSLIQSDLGEDVCELKSTIIRRPKRDLLERVHGNSEL